MRTIFPGQRAGGVGQLALLSVAMLALASCAGANRNAIAKRQQQEDRNKQIVASFYDQVFNQHNVAAANEYLAEDYKQHNPMVASGRKAFIDAFTRFFERSPQWRVEIKRIAADGDLVWVHYHARRDPADRGMAVVDILRLEGGKIVEHWDVVQPVPEKAANDNTMF